MAFQLVRHYIRFCLLGLVLVTTACGWQLRGTSPAADGSKAETVELPDQLRLVMWERNSKMAQTLSQILRSKNIQISDQAPTTLVVESEDVDKRPLAVTDTGVTAQYQLVLTVRYHYESGSGPAKQKTESRKVMSWRSYDFDAQLIVAKNQEEQALLAEMREELGYRMLDAQ